MLELFTRAVTKNGLPSRVRSDQGLENVSVARYMIDKRVPERRSMIVGSSITEFVAAWNNHSIRTAHHHSPQQLFTSGVLLLQHSNSEALDFAEDVDDSYGDNEDELIPDDSEQFLEVEFVLMTATLLL